MTTIRQLLYESGQLGVELLLDILEGLNAAPVCQVLPTELMVRATTVPPAADKPDNLPKSKRDCDEETLLMKQKSI